MTSAPAAALPPRLLASDEPAPVAVVNPDAVAPLLLLCDHAAPRIPRILRGLGVQMADLGRHIAWDIGAADIARHLAGRFGARLVLAAYSRLAIDLNRYPHDPAAIAEASDGTPVPGNLGLAPADRERREAELFRPYHARVAAEIDALVALGRPPLVLSIHSMTDRMNGGAVRPQEIAVCWAGDGRWARPALAALRADPALVVGDNAPYAVDIGIDYTIPEHAMRRGLPWLQIEFRQDLAGSPEGAREWAARLAPALERILADPALMSVEPVSA